jgi:hypothetical protein
MRVLPCLPRLLFSVCSYERRACTSEAAQTWLITRSVNSSSQELGRGLPMARLTATSCIHLFVTSTQMSHHPFQWTGDPLKCCVLDRFKCRSSYSSLQDLIAPVLIFQCLEQYDFMGATVIGTVLLAISLVIMLLVNWIQRYHVLYLLSCPRLVFPSPQWGVFELCRAVLEPKSFVLWTRAQATRFTIEKAPRLFSQK